jgi:alpha-tubulin suppressor-like RCC1 family protein
MRGWRGNGGRRRRIATGAGLILLGASMMQVAAAAPALALSAVSVSAGFDHTCAVTSNGGVKCWGANDQGQLGNGTLTASAVPVSVSGLNRVVAVSAGAQNTCALRSTGALACWGVRNGTSAISTTTPVTVTGLGSGVAAVSAGGDHVCALTTAGGVKCWGGGTYGGLGNGGTTFSATPVDVTGLSSGVVAISSGARHTCALLAGGTVRCWGYNAYGQTGDGTTVNSLVPVDVQGLPAGSTAVTAGGFHSCAITAQGGALCWGQGTNGQLGDGADANSFAPVAVSGLSAGVASLTGGTYHTCAVTTSGAASCWGSNITGQVGDGTTNDAIVPVAVIGLGSGVSGISGGRFHSCAATTLGTVRCWGSNTSGQLGNGSLVNSSVPVQVLGLK